MNIQNGHDVKVHTLNPTDNGICQAKLTEVHPSNISWHPLLAEIFNSPISTGTCHGQRVPISVLCDANQFEPQIGPGGRYATLYKTVYPSQERGQLGMTEGVSRAKQLPTRLAFRAITYLCCRKSFETNCSLLSSPSNKEAPSWSPCPHRTTPTLSCIFRNLMKCTTKPVRIISTPKLNRNPIYVFVRHIDVESNGVVRKFLYQSPL